MPSNEEYFDRVKNEFDLNDELKATVWTAQSMIEMGLLTLDEALEEFNITKAQYDKYQGLPQS